MDAELARAVEAALTAARDYRAVIDQRHQRSVDGFLDQVHPVLARLYASVVSLPETEPTDREYRRPPREAWAELYRDLKGLLGRWDAVREVFDPYDDITDPPVVGSLADALASVYVTCSYVLELTGDAPANDVAWELASSFEIDDGHHAIDAMRAIAAQRKRRA